jgi:hypothetical protein
MKLLSQKTLVTPCMMTLLFFGFTAVASYADNLVQFSDLQYLGAFRLPTNQNLDYGGTALGYNPGSSSSGSLFITCLNTNGTVAEVSIPAPVNSSNLNNLNRASIIQSCGDPTAGSTVGIGSGSSKIGGMLVSEGKLYTSVYLFYDAGASQTAWLFVKPNTNLSQANASGAYTIDNSPNSAGFLDGWMAPIPSVWQTALKGTVASGNCCLSIISRTSWGPAAFAWNPAQLTNVNTTVAATALLYYTQQNPTLGQWNDSTPVNNTTVWWENSGTGYRSGGVIPVGTRSILFFGSQGTGPFCYGSGGTSGADCYDPVDSNKGLHGYPYQFQIMAFDLNDLAAVAAGTKQPYSVLPYAVWPLTTGIIGVGGGDDEYAGGAVYDPTLKRIYFSTPYADGTLPLIQVWQVNTAGGGATVPPDPPINLEIQ